MNVFKRLLWAAFIVGAAGLGGCQWVNRQCRVDYTLSPTICYCKILIDND